MKIKLELYLTNKLLGYKVEIINIKLLVKVLIILTKYKIQDKCILEERMLVGTLILIWLIMMFMKENKDYMTNNFNFE